MSENELHFALHLAAIHARKANNGKMAYAIEQLKREHALRRVSTKMATELAKSLGVEVG